MSMNASWIDGISAFQWSFRAFFVYALGKAIYNLAFHLLSNFPGPKPAASTSSWRLYVEAIQQRSMAFCLRELHGQYGMLVVTEIN